MLVGIDSIVVIEELHAVPNQENSEQMELSYTFTIVEYGEKDQKFGTDLNAAINNRLEAFFLEGLEYED